MGKVRITLEETIRYTDEIIVVQPENMSDELFERIIEQTERKCSFEGAKDFAYELEHRLGLKVESQSFSFPDNPRSSELEVIDVMDIKETKG